MPLFQPIVSSAAVVQHTFALTSTLKRGSGEGVNQHERREWTVKTVDGLTEGEENN